MADRMCSVEGCERQARAKGWCQKHYYALRDFKCTVDGCGRQLRLHGLCMMHWKRSRKPERTFEDLPGETWLPVPGYEGLYEVSDLGRVRSWRVRGRIVGLETIPRLLVQSPAKGYRIVTLRRDGVATSRTVHILVALAFLGPRPADLQVAHGDGDPTNNRLDNLRYDTAKGNAADRVLHGTERRGEANARAKLTEEQVLEIRRRYEAGGIGFQRLANDYGVSKKLVLNIVHRRAWAWLEAS